MGNALKYIIAGVLLCGCACSENGKDKPDDPVTPPEESKDVFQYTTTADKLRLFEETTYSFAKPGTAPQYVVKVTGDTYQTVEGFGAALTVSSCYNILKMPVKERTEFLRQVFDPENGIGCSLVRVAIGGCDFSWDYGESGLSEDGRFTWCDTEGIGNFAPHPMDVKYVIPVLKEIYSINPGVKVIGSPWTAPRWMKTDAKLSGAAHYSWTGGRLAPEHYGDYAAYFV
ncbi:MAG: glucosylceramidase, partial [Candidatus Cryptobacteroides sp.]|nr:glucosylceramidase [Candidatus Cryptobacteroides sp.]